MLNFDVIAPAVESLFDLDRDDSLWPDSIKQDENLTTQSLVRKKLFEKLDYLFKQISDPKMEISQAIDLGLIDHKSTAGLYFLLADFLEIDPLHERLLLYLPLELLPCRSWVHESNVLMLAQKRFVDTYMKCFCDLLSFCDAEANFIDGDILETESLEAPTKMVIQVTRFIPELLAKGLITSDWVQLIRDDSYPLLSSSITEVFPVRAVQQSTISQEGVITEDRARWLRGEKFKRKVKAAAENLSAEILNALVPPEEFAKRCINTFSTLVSIQSLKVTGNRYYEYESFIRELWERNIPHFRDAIISLWSHLFHLNVISQTYLDQFGVKLPSLEGLFSEVSEVVKDEASRIERLFDHLPFLYPTFILFGSQLKGYANSASDFDVAVFARPTTTFLERRLVEQTLGDKVVIFELEEIGDGFKITNLSSWTHVLFGGAWCGEREFIKELRRKLLVKYLSGNTDRSIWFKQMERDAIQYRLLHSGYERFFPKQSDLGTFYDPGFRRLATKIFLKRVFLPIKSE